MPLRIAFDMDGTLADMESALSRHAEALFPGATPDHPERLAGRDRDEDPPTTREEATETPAVPASLNMTQRQQGKLWRHVRSLENFWETLDALEPEVLPRLAGIAADRRWEIIFLTKRPSTAGSTAQVQSQRWLESKGFPLPSVYVVQGSRGRIAAALALDVVVDDRLENCLDVVVDSKARAILVWRDERKRLPPAAKRLGIGVVTNVAECLDVLTQIDAAGVDQPGLMTRVMRALGLKEPVESA